MWRDGDVGGLLPCSARVMEIMQKCVKQGVAYAAPYSILIPIISLQYIDMRIPYFPLPAQ